MNSEIKMCISSMPRTEDKKAVYVLFTDGEASAEYAIPECRLLSNKGFTEDEIKQLKEYINNEQDYLYGLAKEVNPLRNFLGDNKEEKHNGKRIIVDEG